jgi:hypothetical protein
MIELKKAYQIYLSIHDRHGGMPYSNISVGIYDTYRPTDLGLGGIGSMDRLIDRSWGCLAALDTQKRKAGRCAGAWAGAGAGAGAGCSSPRPLPCAAHTINKPLPRSPRCALPSGKKILKIRGTSPPVRPSQETGLLLYRLGCPSAREDARTHNCWLRLRASPSSAPPQPFSQHCNRPG